MQCPYNRKSSRYVRQYRNDFVNEETGVIRSNEEVVIEEYTLMDCPKEGCAVWVDGRCTYNQGVNV